MPRGKRKGHHPNRAVLFTWDGDVMIPLPRFKKLCDQLYTVHEEYPLVVLENRSQASHNHYFAAIDEAFKNLSEEHARRFASSEHMRAYALFEEGYAIETDYVLDTPQVAQGFARALKQSNRKKQIINIIVVEGNVVKEFEPMSQSMSSMKKQMFEESKAAVLARVASWARTTPSQLNKEAKKSGR